MRDHGKALEVIRKSGALNLKMSLDEILTISSQLGATSQEELASWTFISPNFVYTGGALDKEFEQVVTR